jgi:hypothetical protein
MKENQTFSQEVRGCFISLVCLFLAIGAVIMSAKYVYPENPIVVIWWGWISSDVYV